jgi:hypothetical protein
MTKEILLTNADLLTPDSFVNKEALDTLATLQGSCLTLFLPEYAPGGSRAPHRVTAKALLRTLDNQSAGKAFAPLKASLLAALEQDNILEHPAGGPGVVIFAATGFQSSYWAHDLPEHIVAGSQFYLTPLVAQASVNQDLFVLTLSTKRLHLFHYDGSKCERRAFPDGVPDNIEDASQFNRSESGLSNRKAVGASGGRAGGVHFGTISEQKTSDAYLHDFFEIVDRGLHDVLRGRFLLLLGVQEEIAAYRRASARSELLLEGHHGNADSLRLVEIAALARKAATDEYNRRSRAVLDEYYEMSDRHRTSKNVDDVLRTAVSGRIHQLCIREATPVLGKLPDDINSALGANEDLVNAAAVATLRNRGQVYVLPQDQMPATEPVAAILRY